MKSEPKSSNYPGALRPLRGMYPLLDDMVSLGRPLTRDTYLRLSYGEGPADLSGEEEAELPPPFRASKPLPAPQ